MTFGHVTRWKDPNDIICPAGWLISTLYYAIFRNRTLVGDESSIMPAKKVPLFFKPFSIPICKLLHWHGQENLISKKKAEFIVWTPLIWISACFFSLFFGQIKGIVTFSMNYLIGLFRYINFMLTYTPDLSWLNFRILNCDIFSDKLRRFLPCLV